MCTRDREDDSMTSRRYRVKTPTMAILASNGHRTTVTVPSDVIVATSGTQLDGDRLVDVVWNDTGYMMFTQDLRERCEPID